jgi:beta-lactamase regulating signal transducer with metallopeptidase domain
MIPGGSPFYGLIATSLALGFVIGVFLPLRSWLRGVIGSQWVCVLWLALLVRLLLPWPMESRLGLMNAWSIRTAPAGQTAGPWTVRVSFPGNAAIESSSSQAPPDPAQIQSTQTSPPLDIPLVIWVGGFAASLALLAWRHLQTRRLAARTLPVTDGRLLAIYGSIPAQARRNVRLRMTGVVNVPTLAGVWHPQIWMPEPWLAQFNDEELRSILLHELGHARRGDLAAQWLFAFAQCLHWFNPFVWLAARAARLDREMACDAWVLTHDNPNATPAYGATLLKTAQLLRLPRYKSAGCTVPGPSTTVAMASSHRTLHARIIGISAFRPTRAWPGLLGIASMIGILALLTTSRTTAGQSPVPNPSAIQTPVKSVAGSNPSAPPVSGTGSAFRGDLIRIDAKFVEIDEHAWKELSAENPDFKKVIAMADRPVDRYVKVGTDPYITTVATLNALGTNKWEYDRGAWQTTDSIYGWDVLSEDQFQTMLKSFDQRKGVDLLSSPSVITHQRQTARIEAVTEFRYPSALQPDKDVPIGWSPEDFVTKDLGVTLEASGYVESRDRFRGMINLDLNPEVSDFLGFLEETNGNKSFTQDSVLKPGSFWHPVFSNSRGETQLTIRPNQTVLLRCCRLDRQNSQFVGESSLNLIRNDASGDPRIVNRLLLVFVTADIIPPDKQSTASTPPAGAAPTPAHT